VVRPHRKMPFAQLSCNVDPCTTVLYRLYFLAGVQSQAGPLKLACACAKYRANVIVFVVQCASDLTHVNGFNRAEGELPEFMAALPDQKMLGIQFKHQAHSLLSQSPNRGTGDIERLARLTEQLQVIESQWQATAATLDATGLIPSRRTTTSLGLEPQPQRSIDATAIQRSPVGRRLLAARRERAEEEARLRGKADSDSGSVASPPPQPQRKNNAAGATPRSSGGSQLSSYFLDDCNSTPDQSPRVGGVGRQTTASEDVFFNGAFYHDPEANDEVLIASPCSDSFGAPAAETSDGGSSSTITAAGGESLASAQRTAALARLKKISQARAAAVAVAGPAHAAGAVEGSNISAAPKPFLKRRPRPGPQPSKVPDWSAVKPKTDTKLDSNLILRPKRAQAHSAPTTTAAAGNPTPATMATAAARRRPASNLVQHEQLQAQLLELERHLQTGQGIPAPSAVLPRQPLSQNASQAAEGAGNESVPLQYDIIRPTGYPVVAVDTNFSTLSRSDFSEAAGSIEGAGPLDELLSQVDELLARVERDIK
jgi:hypothetical protein